MTAPLLRPRRAGPIVSVVIDLLRQAVWSRRWLVPVVVLIGVAAVLFSFAGQAVLPWAIYPAL